MRASAPRCPARSPAAARCPPAGRTGSRVRGPVLGAAACRDPPPAARTGAGRPAAGHPMPAPSIPYPCRASRCQAYRCRCGVSRSGAGHPVPGTLHPQRAPSTRGGSRRGPAGGAARPADGPRQPGPAGASPERGTPAGTAGAAGTGQRGRAGQGMRGPRDSAVGNRPRKAGSGNRGCRRLPLCPRSSERNPPTPVPASARPCPRLGDGCLTQPQPPRCCEPRRGQDRGDGGAAGSTSRPLPPGDGGGCGSRPHTSAPGGSSPASQVTTAGFSAGTALRQVPTGRGVLPQCAVRAPGVGTWAREPAMPPPRQRGDPWVIPSSSLGRGHIHSLCARGPQTVLATSLLLGSPVWPALVAHPNLLEPPFPWGCLSPPSSG